MCGNDIDFKDSKIIHLLIKLTIAQERALNYATRQQLHKQTTIHLHSRYNIVQYSFKQTLQTLILAPLTIYRHFYIYVLFYLWKLLALFNGSCFHLYGFVYFYAN